MLTNEQRAHDIAIATLNNNTLHKEFIKDGHLDIFEIYDTVYELALEALNKRFPNKNENIND